MDTRGAKPSPWLKAALWLWLALALGAYLFQFRAIAARLVRLVAG